MEAVLLKIAVALGKLVLIFLTVKLFFRWIVFPALRLWVAKRVIESRPRAEVMYFLSELKTVVFRDPFTAMRMLWSADSSRYLREIWLRATREAERWRHGTGVDPAGLAAHCSRFADGRAIAVICLPEAQKPSEPLLIGIVMPCDDATLEQDIPRARQQTHFFVLSGFIGPDRTRDTDLCSYTSSGQEFTYNVGAPRDVAGFARAVERKLVELKK